MMNDDYAIYNFFIAIYKAANLFWQFKDTTRSVKYLLGVYVFSAKDYG